MKLTVLEADRLRNLKAVHLSLPIGLTIVTGRNAQGKSSLLDAIYLLGTGRSFRTRRFEELLAWDTHEGLRVAGTVENRLGQSRLRVIGDRVSRHLLVDGSERELDDFIGRLAVVDLTAERMGVLRGGPVDRRRFLDRGVLSLKPIYLKSLGRCRRILQQRNALLRSGSGQRGAELDAWDERLVVAAADLHRRRAHYAERLGATLCNIAEAVCPGPTNLTLRYRPSPPETAQQGPDGFEEIYAAALTRARARDQDLGHTSHGPHRDEMVVEWDGIDLRRYGSAGQVRASMVALKLGKLSLVREELGHAPLFLMDDFDADLDEVRASALAEFLTAGGFQALVATSKESMADRLGVPFTKVRMDDGTVQAA